MSSKYRCQTEFSTHSIPAPGLHDHSIVWEDLQYVTYEKFCRLHSDLNIPLKGNSPEDPCGLQYKHFEPRKPKMIAGAYDCLATMWQDRHILASWKWKQKWLVSILKNAFERIQDLRLIMLNEALQTL